MRLQVFSENEWLYPDTPLSRADARATLHAARGGMVCLQILTDRTNEAKSRVDVSWENVFGIRPTLYQLLPVCVDRNSGRENLTSPYADVADFVTREAPFSVFDAMREPADGLLAPGRLALYVRFEAEEFCAPGARSIGLTFTAGGETARLDIDLTVHACSVPPLSQARFGMVNWLNVKEVCRQHGIAPDDEARFDVLDRYLADQIETRNTHLQLPSGVPLRDAEGKVTGFDFAVAGKLGDMALKRGFKYVMGGFVARFADWREAEHYLLWDRSVGISTREGYRQLKLYFEGAARLVRERGWEGRYMQTLVDEPQFPNSIHYRVLSSICRKFLPGVPIHDPVESTELEGALEIWCVKQAVFERYIDQYRALQALGEEMWLYTCGFPAGKMMNRVMDLPLTASRLPMWLCKLYGCTGFLHWGYNVHSEKPFEITSYRPDPKDDSVSYPAGNAHIVYPGDGGPLTSVRAQLQRAGAEDYELLDQLCAARPEAARAIIESVCRDFSDYEADGARVDRAREALLEALDAL